MLLYTAILNGERESGYAENEAVLDITCILLDLFGKFLFLPLRSIGIAYCAQ